MKRRTTKTRAIAAALFGALSLSGCGGGGDNRDVVVGPCVVIPDGPSLVIAAATDVVTGAAIPVLTLTDVTVGGTKVLPFPDAIWVNIQTVGLAMECTTACGFSSLEGFTTFTASAPGYASQIVTTTSAYARRSGTCPNRLSEGARISVTLTPL